MSDERGFSLVELAIVLVVAGIVMSFGLPAFGRYRDDLKLRQVRQQLTEDIRMARQLAVTRRCPVFIKFGTSTSTTDISSYQIHIDSNSNYTLTSGERVWTRTVPSGTRLSNVVLGTPDTLAFDISGILIPSVNGGTPGGTLVYRNSRMRYDTLAVSTAGIVYHP